MVRGRVGVSVCGFGLGRLECEVWWLEETRWNGDAKGEKEVKEGELPLASFAPLPARPWLNLWATDAVQRPVPLRLVVSVVQRRIGMLGFLPGLVRIGAVLLV